MGKKNKDKKQEKLFDLLERIDDTWLDNIGIGPVSQFEAMTKVDFDYFWRRLLNVIPAVDEYGNEVFNEDGSTKMVKDPEAEFNPAPIPNKTRCLAVIVWLRNRDLVDGLTVPQIEEEISYKQLWELLREAPAEDDDDAAEDELPL